MLHLNSVLIEKLIEKYHNHQKQLKIVQKFDISKYEFLNDDIRTKLISKVYWASTGSWNKIKEQADDISEICRDILTNCTLAFEQHHKRFENKSVPINFSKTGVLFPNDIHLILDWISEISFHVRLIQTKLFLINHENEKVDVKWFTLPDETKNRLQSNSKNILSSF